MPTPDVTIHPTLAEDGPAVTCLVELCFPGPARRRTAALLRADSPPIPGLAFVARAGGGALVGSLACHPVRVVPAGGPPRPLVLLGPLAVAPEWRGRGIGGALMACAVEALDARGLDSMLIGDAPFYGRFGYSADATGQWTLPGPVERHRLLLRAAAPASWQGPAEVRPERAAARAA